MRPSRGMGIVNPKKLPRSMPRKTVKRDGNEPVALYAKGGKTSSVNKAGNYTKPGMRKALFDSIKASATHGTAAGQWSARKAQLLAKRYKEKGGGYK
jgi:hypothetical protein